MTERFKNELAELRRLLAFFLSLSPNNSERKLECFSLAAESVSSAPTATVDFDNLFVLFLLGSSI